jgi:hypothetical protein
MIGALGKDVLVVVLTHVGRDDVRALAPLRASCKSLCLLVDSVLVVGALFTRHFGGAVPASFLLGNNGASSWWSLYRMEMDLQPEMLRTRKRAGPFVSNANDGGLVLAREEAEHLLRKDSQSMNWLLRYRAEPHELVVSRVSTRQTAPVGPRPVAHMLLCRMGDNYVEAKSGENYGSTVAEIRRTLFKLGKLVGHQLLSTGEFKPRAYCWWKTSESGSLRPWVLEVYYNGNEYAVTCDSPEADYDHLRDADFVALVEHHSSSNKHICVIGIGCGQVACPRIDAKLLKAGITYLGKNGIELICSENTPYENAAPAHIPDHWLR